MRQIRLNPPGRSAAKPVPRVLPVLADRAFLAPALAIVETPASPILMSLMITICVFMMATLAWSWFGHIDVIVAARGKIEPLGHIKVIQPLETGKISKILVTEGEKVRSGAVLAELDAREAEADLDAASQAETNALAEEIRRSAAIAAITDGCWDCDAKLTWSAAIPQAVRVEQEQVLHSDLREIAASVTHLDDQAAEKTAAIAQTAMSIESQQHLLSILKERVEMRSELVRRDAGSRASVIDSMQQLWEAQTRLSSDLGKQGMDNAALVSIRSERARTIQVALAEQTRKMTDARQLAELKHSERLKAQARLDHLTLRAPIGGFVQNLSLTTVGQVVTPGQEIMRLLPESEAYEIQAYVSNEDIAFIRPGQEVAVKVDAFPFSRYGTLPGHIIRVSRDAVPAASANDALIDHSRTTNADAPALTPTAKPTTDLVFEVGVKLDENSFTVEGSTIPVSPGMSLSVEARTGSRRILDYVFSPLVDIASTAMRER